MVNETSRTNEPPRAWAASWARTLRERAVAIVVASLVVTGLSVALATRLSISTDLSAVLPRGYSSVEDLHKLRARVGGTASLTIAVESQDMKANERFADELVLAMKREMGAQIATVDYKTDVVESFYRKHAAVYLSREDLLAIEQDLKGAEHAEVQRTPLYDIFGESEEPARGPGASSGSALRSVHARLDRARVGEKSFPDSYFTGEDGHLLAIFVRPKKSGSDTQDARAFIAQIRRIVDRLEPRTYDAALKVGFTGAFVISLDEQDAIKRDLLSTAGLCVGLIAAAVFAYFRRVRVLLLLGATLLCGCAWAFGLAQVAVGYLNIQTAFLGSIIMGTGINYGIIFLARYLEERRRGIEDELSLARALESTLVATLTAAATTAISFGTLFIADISSFRDFAIIGGGGIVFCWALSFTLLPALLVISNRFVPTVRHAEPGVRWPAPLVMLPLRFPRALAFVSAIACVVAVGAFVRFAPSALETDGRNLRNKASHQSAAELDRRIAPIHSGSTTPAFILTDSLKESKDLCEVLDAWVKRVGDAGPISSCTSIYSLLPQDQDDKLVVSRRIVHGLDSLPDDALTGADKAELDDLRSKLSLEKVTLDDLPEELTRPFREIDGQLGRVVAVDPPTGRDLWISKNLFQFTDAVRRIDLGDGRVVTSSGDAVIFADILRMISRDAPRTTLLALSGVLLFVFLALRGGRATAHVVGALVVGVVWMVGIASLAQVKVNFFNFVALPTTFGIAVDYTINVYARFASARGEGKDRAARLREALAETGGAVALCSITTIVGYATLIIADNMALVSFGKLAILGELTCVAAALFFLPVTLLLDRKA